MDAFFLMGKLRQILFVSFIQPICWNSRHFIEALWRHKIVTLNFELGVSFKKPLLMLSSVSFTQDMISAVSSKLCNLDTEIAYCLIFLIVNRKNPKRKLVNSKCLTSKQIGWISKRTFVFPFNQFLFLPNFFARGSNVLISIPDESLNSARAWSFDLIWSVNRLNWCLSRSVFTFFAK